MELKTKTYQEQLEILNSCIEYYQNTHKEAESIQFITDLLEQVKNIKANQLFRTIQVKILQYYTVKVISNAIDSLPYQQHDCICDNWLLELFKANTRTLIEKINQLKILQQQQHEMSVTDENSQQLNKQLIYKQYQQFQNENLQHFEISAGAVSTILNILRKSSQFPQCFDAIIVLLSETIYRPDNVNIVQFLLSDRIYKNIHMNNSLMRTQFSHLFMRLLHCLCCISNRTSVHAVVLLNILATERKRVDQFITTIITNEMKQNNLFLQDFEKSFEVYQERALQINVINRIYNVISQVHKMMDE